MSQPPKSKGRDDTEYAKGIIKGREMQYKLDKLGEHPQTDKTTWEDRSRILINEWVMRMIKFGDLNLPKRSGRFVVFECPDLNPFIAELLKEEIGKQVAFTREDYELTKKRALDAYRGKLIKQIEKMKMKGIARATYNATIDEVLTLIKEEKNNE